MSVPQAKYEKALADHFIGHRSKFFKKQYMLKEKPGKVRVSRPEGWPDFLYEDSCGSDCVLELKRWVPDDQELRFRALEKFVQYDLDMNLQGQLTGTFRLILEATWDSKNLQQVKQALLQEITTASSGSQADIRQSLPSGFELWKVSNQGSTIGAWITSTSYDKLLSNSELVGLESRLKSILGEANQKFKGFDQATKILLLDTTWLCDDFEEYYSSSTHQWCHSIKSTTQGWLIDEIYLVPQIRVGQGYSSRVLTGHKYDEKEFNILQPVYPAYSWSKQLQKCI